MKGRRLIVLGLILALLAAPVGGALVVFVGAAKAASWEIKRRGLPWRDHNALKHAYASAELYALLRPFLSPEKAQRIVLTLGEINERMEVYLKHDPDWSRESYKDMRNNLYGVVASEWLYNEAGYTLPTTRLALIGKLVELRLLVPQPSDARLADIPDQRDASISIPLIREHEYRLQTQFIAETHERSAELRADLRLD